MCVRVPCACACGCVRVQAHLCARVTHQYTQVCVRDLGTCGRVWRVWARAGSACENCSEATSQGEGGSTSQGHEHRAQAAGTSGPGPAATAQDGPRPRVSSTSGRHPMAPTSRPASLRREACQGSQPGPRSAAGPGHGVPSSSAGGTGPVTQVPDGGAGESAARRAPRPRARALRRPRPSSPARWPRGRGTARLLGPVAAHPLLPRRLEVLTPGTACPPDGLSTEPRTCPEPRGTRCGVRPRPGP